MGVGTIRGLYDYHRWANRRLFDVATALGEDLASHEVGKQFSFPTIKRMFGHLYGADWVWLSRWKGVSPTRLPGAEFPTLASTPRLVLDEGAEVAAAQRVAQLSEGLGLDLPDALACDRKAPADLFEGMLPLLADAEPEAQDLLLLGRERRERSLDLRRQVLVEE